MTLHLLISGHVQRVGYRQFVKEVASLLELTGWVKNIPEKRVEVLACGGKESLEKLIQKCKKGPFLASVKDIKEEWLEEKVVFEDFSIIID